VRLICNTFIRVNPPVSFATSARARLMSADARETWIGSEMQPLYGHIKTAEQHTIIQQYGDWYTGRYWVGCYIWYSEDGTGRSSSPPRPLLAVPNVTAHPSTANVPTSYYLMWHYDCPLDSKGLIWRRTPACTISTAFVVKSSSIDIVLDRRRSNWSTAMHVVHFWRRPTKTEFDAKLFIYKL